MVPGVLPDGERRVVLAQAVQAGLKRDAPGGLGLRVAMEISIEDRWVAGQ
jgi:hypothetical protein